mmetsp:Transcript_73178/g.136758  ORF Transcript_73178/g.136758 Transcript_73178/m.136758 type:complete len:351 (+) Transcript_73178:111-1163(+)
MDAADVGRLPLVSVILPCHNGAHWLQACLESIALQQYRPLELSFWNDASVDESGAVLEASLPMLHAAGISTTLGATNGSQPLGCGAAKNSAVRQSLGAYLCFQDADDIMLADRIELQLKLVLEHGSDSLAGSNVVRDPADAQPRHTAWLNALDSEQLWLQRFKECTIAMPTWFCGRSVFERVGGFSEAGPGTPEDLIFFYAHLRMGGTLAKVPKPLVVYRYHENQTSHSVGAERIWALRVEAMQHDLLDHLGSFSIWSAGRDGKRFYRSLNETNRAKVLLFLDVDEKKLSAGHYYDRESQRHVPVVLWTRATDATIHPIIICVKAGLHEGFEENVRSLQLTEGVHYWHFH